MPQLNAADLKTLTPRQIEDARTAGHLAVLLGADPAEADLIERATTDPITTTDVRRLAALGRHDLIEAARLGGRLTLTTTED